MPQHINYTPSKTVREFMLSEHSFRVLCGPVGGGKTTGAIMELLRQAIKITPGDDGLRRSKMLIVRSTKQQLKDTTLASVISNLPEEIYTWRESDGILRLNFGDVRSDWLFRPLDTPEDIQRVLSLEVTWAWLEESRELPVSLIPNIEGRVGRYPSQAGGFTYRSGIIATTNPPEIDGEWYKLMEHLPQEEGNDNSIIDCDVFRQPSGLSPEAENIGNLRDSYYEKLSKGKTSEWVNVYVHGEYSQSQAGKPVYTTFKVNRHVSKVPLQVDPTLPVIVGQDCARSPASVFMQYGHDGRLRILRECTGFDMGAKTFLQMKINPTFKNYFSSCPIVFIGDPSWTRQNETDDNSWYKELKNWFPKDKGHHVKAAATNDPIARINALDELLRSWPDGDPAVIMDPSCKMLIEGLRSKYRYTKLKGSDNKHHERPEKNNWSHVVEAAQYGALFLTGKYYDSSDYVRTAVNLFKQGVQSRIADSYAGY